jgi:hypothetical protein
MVHCTELGLAPLTQAVVSPWRAPALMQPSAASTEYPLGDPDGVSGAGATGAAGAAGAASAAGAAGATAGAAPLGSGGSAAGALGGCRMRGAAGGVADGGASAGALPLGFGFAASACEFGVAGGVRDGAVSMCRGSRGFFGRDVSAAYSRERSGEHGHMHTRLTLFWLYRISTMLEGAGAAQQCRTPSVKCMHIRHHC